MIIGFLKKIKITCLLHFKHPKSGFCWYNFFYIETDNYASFWFYDFCCTLDFIIKPTFLKSILRCHFWWRNIFFSTGVLFMSYIFHFRSYIFEFVKFSKILNLINLNNQSFFWIGKMGNLKKTVDSNNKIWFPWYWTQTGLNPLS